jgi:hypothetical protein
MERWYRADYDVVGMDDMHDEYFVADSDEQAIEIAKEMASDGIWYADAGLKKLELVQVVLVDENTEYYNEIKTIYY